MKIFNMESPFRDNAVHIIYYSYNDVIKLFEKNGFKLVKYFNEGIPINQNWPFNDILFTQFKI